MIIELSESSEKLNNSHNSDEGQNYKYKKNLYLNKKRRAGDETTSEEKSNNLENVVEAEAHLETQEQTIKYNISMSTEEKIIFKIFKDKFENFINNSDYFLINNFSNNEIDLINSKIYELSQLYLLYKRMGVIGGHIFDEFAICSKLFETGHKARQIFEIYLYNFCKISIKAEELNGKDKNFISESLKKEAKILNSHKLNNLIQVPYEKWEDFKNISENDISLMLSDRLDNCDILLLKGFADKLFKIDSSLFTVDYLIQFHSNDFIEVIQQNFNPKPYNNNQKKHKMRVHEYASYLQNKKNESIFNDEYEAKEEISHDHLFHAVNISMQGMPLSLKELKSKLNPLISPGSFFDCLSYSNRLIKGLNFPELSIKELGVWVGAQEQNSRTSYFNINHGKHADCEWYAIPIKYTDRFLKYLDSKTHMDFYSSNGKCFFDFEELIDKKIPFYYTRQKPGDIVIISPGCIYWNRSLGECVNSSWNILFKKEKDIVNCLEKIQINKTRKVNSLIPINTIVLNILNLEIDNPDICKKTLKTFEEILKNQIEINKNILNEYSDKFPFFANSNIAKCDLCETEIFSISFSCPNSEYPEDKKYLNLCLECYQKEMKFFDKNITESNNKTVTHLNGYVCYKYKLEDLEILYSRLNQRILSLTKADIKSDDENLSDKESNYSNSIEKEYHLSQQELFKYTDDSIEIIKIKKSFLEKINQPSYRNILNNFETFLINYSANQPIFTSEKFEFKSITDCIMSHEKGKLILKKYKIAKKEHFEANNKIISLNLNANVENLDKLLNGAVSTRKIRNYSPDDEEHLLKNKNIDIELYKCKRQSRKGKNISATDLAKLINDKLYQIHLEIYEYCRRNGDLIIVTKSNKKMNILFDLTKEIVENSTNNSDVEYLRRIEDYLMCSLRNRRFRKFHKDYQDLLNMFHEKHGQIKIPR